MKALIIDDDTLITSTLSARLSENGFSCESADTGKRGVEMTNLYRYDILIVDLNLPDISGEQVVAQIREREHAPPILMMTVVNEVDSKVRLLNAGADDYVAKPFSFDEMLARIRALIRRPQTQVYEKLTVQNLELDSRTQEVYRANKKLPLTRKEFDILERLMRQKGGILSKGELIEHIWESTADPFSAAFDTHLTNLRKKLGEPELIHTIHGRGYRLQ